MRRDQNIFTKKDCFICDKSVEEKNFWLTFLLHPTIKQRTTLYMDLIHTECVENVTGADYVKNFKTSHKCYVCKKEVSRERIHHGIKSPQHATIFHTTCFLRFVGE